MNAVWEKGYGDAPPPYANDKQTPVSSMTDTPATDDCILPFQIETSGARGRLIRLGATVSDILARHGYPEPVSVLLGEAIVLAAMLGSSLKIDGKFILQASRWAGSLCRRALLHVRRPARLRQFRSRRLPTARPRKRKRRCVAVISS